MQSSEQSLPAVPSSWQHAVPTLQPIYENIAKQLEHEEDIRPKQTLWFEALRRVAPADVKVVILGQDPYHGEDHGIHQAHGLSFSVPDGVRPPPSLKNILKEMESDLGQISSASSGNLSAWADQGVLLLNAALTTRGGIAGAHRKYWKKFTHELMAYLGSRQQATIFILWGGDAQKYTPLIASHHTVIESVHPSPLSVYRGFFGSKPFSKTNEALILAGLSKIHW